MRHITALNIGSGRFLLLQNLHTVHPVHKCSFTTCKLRFCAHFRLARKHNPTFYDTLYWMCGLLRRGTQEPVGSRPCGCIQPIKKDTTSSTNSAIDNTIRMVRNFTVRLVSPRSLIRLTMPAPRLMSISANRSKIIIFMIIK